MDEASSILEESEKEFPTSAIFLYFKALIFRSRVSSILYHDVEGPLSVQLREVIYASENVLFLPTEGKVFTIALTTLKIFLFLP